MPLALTPLFPALLLLALPLPPGRVASTERFCLSQRELRVMGVALGLPRDSVLLRLGAASSGSIASA